MQTFAVLTLTRVACPSASFDEAMDSVQGRTLTELPGLPENVLQRAIAPWFYKSLLVSPLEGWIITRGELSNTKVHGARIIRSDLKGEFDARIVQAADELKIAGVYQLDRLAKTSPVVMHTLVYQIADGPMFVSFALLDRAEGAPMYHNCCARGDVLEESGQGVKRKVAGG